MTGRAGQVPALYDALCLRDPSGRQWTYMPWGPSDDANQFAAARRLGFVYEGTWRKATIYKGRNRDTAWLAMTDTDWMVRKRAISAWLHPANFDADGRQRSALSALTALSSSERATPPRAATAACATGP